MSWELSSELIIGWGLELLGKDRRSTRIEKGREEMSQERNHKRITKERNRKIGRRKYNSTLPVAGGRHSRTD